MKQVIETSLKQWKEEDERDKSNVMPIATKKHKAVEVPIKAPYENHYGTLQNHTEIC
jgi:hypothetical protein